MASGFAAAAFIYLQSSFSLVIHVAVYAATYFCARLIFSKLFPIHVSKPPIYLAAPARLDKLERNRLEIVYEFNEILQLCVFINLPHSSISLQSH